MTNLPPEVASDPRYLRVRDECERHVAEVRAVQTLCLRMTRVFVVA